ncbi:hypothetical protein IVB69_00835 [Flavobacterium sp. J49]|uniref:D-alanyl-lipoteichoic acid biosynthesis protein DltD n=1 Tax=Flavobacterium sp. J49 TaxID=2718534 RepID=UPI0015945CF7|nr:D-alanyl-lipoteichoic acid biosynthesis protein DltD [Flavobacterium sp. J49]MBF6640013.1 hypothetical protein [Flavobacterium sp. J49]NIC01258.1 hypothetical protein [Flavobacterium sp. J49]
MKKFLIKIFIFLSPFIVVTLFFEVYLRIVNTHYKEKLNGLYDNNDKIELLILGNSHANYGINPKQINIESYNMAMVNQPLLHDYKILAKVIDSLPNLKAVVINLDYHSLYFSNQGIRENWVFYDYGIDTNIETAAKLSRFWIGYTPKVAFSMLKYDVKTYAYSLKNRNPTLNFKVEEGVSFTDTIYNGWLGYTGSKSKKFTTESIQNRADIFNENITRKSERFKNLIVFNSILKLLDKKNIRAYVITMPCHPKFRDMINENVRQKDIKEIEKAIKGYNAIYIDFFDAINKEEFYYDSDHLNKQGATFFSKKLNSYIQ